MTNYRLLNDGEVIEQGDEFYIHRCWTKTYNVGLKQGCDKFIRRRPITDAQPVGTWIPTKERLPNPTPERRVLTQELEGERYTTPVKQVSSVSFVAWQEIPEPYVPPKPKRRETLMLHPVEEKTYLYRQVLPGDPPDLDAFLDVVDKLLDYDPNAFAELRAARHGEVGER